MKVVSNGKVTENGLTMLLLINATSSKVNLIILTIASRELRFDKLLIVRIVQGRVLTAHLVLDGSHADRLSNRRRTVLSLVML